MLIKTVQGLGRQHREKKRIGNRNTFCMPYSLASLFTETCAKVPQCRPLNGFKKWTRDFVLLAYISTEGTSLLLKKTYISRKPLNLVNICYTQANSLPFRSWMHTLLLPIYHFKKGKEGAFKQEQLAPDLIASIAG